MSEDAPWHTEPDARPHTELAELRRRAYGPNADIATDPAAMARLAELENRARPRAPVATPRAEVVGDNPTTEDPLALISSREITPDDPPTVTGAEPLRTPRPLRWVVSAAVAVAAIAIAGYSITQRTPSSAGVSSESASEPAPVRTPRYFYSADPSTESLQQLRLDLWPSGYFDLASRRDLPEFPSSAAIEWARPLGEYYGWRLWIAGSAGSRAGGEHCIAIVRADESRARCAPIDDQALGILRVSLARDDIDPADQPRAMYPDERVRFWWRTDGVLDIVLGSYGRSG